MMNKKILSAVLLLSLGLFSCQNDGVLDDIQHQTENTSILSRSVTSNDDSHYIKEVAKYLSQAVRNKEFISLLANEAKQQIDGDYDVLFAKSFSTKERCENPLLISFINNIPQTMGINEKNGDL